MKYLPITYLISFKEAPVWRNRPSFVFRSVLGLALKRLTCALKLQDKCADCMVKSSCVYSVFFETNIDKDIQALPGRDRAVHPFVVDIVSLNEKEAVLVITFIGLAINYIPYINIALENAGELGIGKNRAKFTVEAISANGEKFVPSVRIIEKQCLNWPSKDNLSKQPVAVKLVTPCRIKKQGKYISEIDLDSLLANMNRRISALIELFGDDQDKKDEPCFSPCDSQPTEQKWVEKTYYSSRQKTRMQFGGVVGKIIINENVPAEDKALIEAMELFHVGKNISFGLGKVEVEYK